VTATQAARLQVLTVAARLGVPLETVESWPQESQGLTTIDGVHQPILSSERDTRDTDRCPPPWETESC